MFCWKSFKTLRCHRLWKQIFFSGKCNILKCLRIVFTMNCIYYENMFSSKFSGNFFVYNNILISMTRYLVLNLNIFEQNYFPTTQVQVFPVLTQVNLLQLFFHSHVSLFLISNQCLLNSIETQRGPPQIFKMESFTTIVNG